MRTEQEQTRLLRSFLDISVQLTQELDIGRVLATIVERSMELTGARYGAALTLAEDGGVEDFLHRGLTPDEVEALPHLPEGKGLLGVVLREREPVCVERIQDHPESIGFPHRHVPMDAFLGVPMLHREELVGALYLSKPPGDAPFTEHDEELTRAMVAMAAVGIENARLFTAETQRAERSVLLQQIASRVRRTLDVSEVLTTTVEMLGRAAGVDRCFIRLVEGTGEGTLGAIEYEWDARGVAPLPKDAEHQYPVSSLAARTRTTQWSDDITRDPRLLDPAVEGNPSDLLQNAVYAALSAPLMWGEQLLGVVTFQSELPRHWSHADRSLIEAAAREVAVALHHARVYDEAVKTGERLQELDRMRSDFVSMVTHELRSPMTVVSGIAEILQRYESLDPDKRTQLLQTLGREARRLTRLVSEVLDLEAVERGSKDLRCEPVDLGALARESVADAGEEERAEVVVTGDDATVSGDRDRIKQVLLNLISNAAKFSPDGTPIRLTVTPDERCVTVSVADQGPGIPEGERSRLFQPFTRLDLPGPRQPGSGVGLYLSRTIVERHGGAIWADSIPGRGATFSVRLPR